MKSWNSLTLESRFQMVGLIRWIPRIWTPMYGNSHVVLRRISTLSLSLTNHKEALSRTAIFQTTTPRGLPDDFWPISDNFWPVWSPKPFQGPRFLETTPWATKQDVVHHCPRCLRVLATRSRVVLPKPTDEATGPAALMGLKPKFV